MDDLDEDLPLDQQEDLSDLGLAEDWFAGTSLWGTDWTTETIVNQLRRGNINLNPRFQRRNAWDPIRKSRFIESLVLGLPVPQIVLAEERGKKGSFVVIDGKQRLLTLRQFSARPEGDNFDQLKLAGLTDRPTLNGLTYADLQGRDDLASDLNTFENQTIRTVVIRGWINEHYLYSVFLRINTGSVQLSPQELRQALHPGPFSDFIDDVSVNHNGVRCLLKLSAPDFRMRDVELVLRYFAYRNFAPEYDGNLKNFLDTTTLRFNQDWGNQQGILNGQADDLDAALARIREIFTERNEVRKWNGQQYEKRINRAVFDVMAYYFSDPQVRDLSRDREEPIRLAFQHLCEGNRAFLSSIEQTTKSREANRVRFEAWARELNGLLGTTLQSPFGE